MEKDKYFERRFRNWLKMKDKEYIELSVEDKLELLAFSVAPWDITQ